MKQLFGICFNYRHLIIMTGISLLCHCSYAQIQWDLTNRDTTVTGGAHVMYIGNLTVADSSQVYTCNVKAENVNLPNGWSYIICSPFYCASNGVPSVSFIYPDTINQHFFNNGWGSEYSKIEIITPPGSMNEIGELDFILTNVNTNESYTSHLIVRTSGPLAIDNPAEEALRPYYNPTDQHVYFKQCNLNETYAIRNTLGQTIATGTTTGTIDCSNLHPGNYFILLTNNRNEALLRISKP